MTDDMNYHSLAEEPMSPMPMEQPSEPYYPTVYLNLKNFPELKGYSVSDKLEICFLCRIKSIHETEEKKEVCLELRAGAVEEVEKEGYEEKSPAIAVVVVQNEADTAMGDVMKQGSRRF